MRADARDNECINDNATATSYNDGGDGDDNSDSDIGPRPEKKV